MIVYYMYYKWWDFNNILNLNLNLISALWVPNFVMNFISDLQQVGRFLLNNRNIVASGVKHHNYKPINSSRFVVNDVLSIDTYPCKFNMLIVIISFVVYNTCIVQRWVKYTKSLTFTNNKQNNTWIPLIKNKLKKNKYHNVNTK